MNKHSRGNRSNNDYIRDVLIGWIIEDFFIKLINNEFFYQKNIRLEQNSFDKNRIIKCGNISGEADFIFVINVPKVFNTFIVDNEEVITISNYLKRELEPLGYNIKEVVLNSKDYGTAQSRKRGFFLISKDGNWEMPEKIDEITVEDVIGHLPSLESEQASDIPFHYAKKHNDRHIQWMKHTPTGRTAFENEICFPQKSDGVRISGYNTTYKRINWDKPAPTITMANGSISSQNNVHPGRELEDGTYSDARVLTLKEIFILTGLSDDWTPPNWASESLIRKVIGEGIPPLLTKAIIFKLNLT